MSSPSQPPSAPSLQELRAARGKSPSALRRFRKWIIAGGGLLALILFGFFGLPPIVQAQATKQLSARLGRTVTIERIRINPLVLSVTVEGFAVAEANPAAGEFAGWRRLHVNFDSWPFLVGKIRFQEIELDGFRARVAKGREGGLNFDDIVARLLAPDPAVPPSGPKDPKSGSKPLAIGRLAVTDARVSFDDASGDRPFATVVGPLTFSLDNFLTVGGPDSPYQFEAVTATGERLAWKGTISTNPVKSQGELVLANIDLAHLSPYYHQLVKGELRSAFADVSGRYTFGLKDGVPALTFEDGALTLRELRFGAPGVEADAFALRRFAATGISADSVSRKATIAKIEVGGVSLKATRDANGIDLLRLFASGDTDRKAVPSAAPAAPVASAPAARPAVTVGEFALSGLRAELTDLTTPRRAEHRVEDVVLSVQGFDSANLAGAVPLSLEVKLPDEGRILVSGALAPQPLGAELEIAVERVPFAHISPYVEPFLNVRLAGGTLRSHGKVSLREGKAGFAGDLGIAGFASVDGKLAQDFVKWSDLSIDGILVTSEPLSLHADKIRLADPSGQLRIEADGTLSIAQVSPPPPREKTPPEPVATVRVAEDHPATKPAVGTRTGPVMPENPFPFALTVDRIEIERGAFRFEDRSVKPAARGGLADFSGKVSGLSSETLGRAEVDLQGRVDGVAPVFIAGKLNPLGTPAFVDLKVDFKGIDLQPGGGPYIAKFTGRNLERGNLSLAVTARLDERRVDVANLVTLEQFYLGSKNNSPDATKLPVGLALSLLRDTQGRIVVDLPVEGSLDDPNFRIGRVVLRVLTNILAKAATSPFSLLGAAFGGGGDELGWQDFGPGQARPDDAGIKKLETVARAMNGRPALSLEIAGAYDPVNDLAALRFERLDAQVRAAAWEARRLVDPNTPEPGELNITPQLHAGMVAKLYAGAFPSEPGTPSGDGTEAAPVPSRPVERPATPAEEEPATRRKIARLPKFYVKGEYARGTPVPALEPAPAAKPGSDPAGAAAAEPQGETDAPGDGGTSVPAMTLEEMEARLAARIEIPPAELQAVGEARAQAIRAWLVETGKVTPERILLAPVAATGIRVNLQLR